MQDGMHSTLLYGPYYDMLGEVNAIALESGEKIEGNLIYAHHAATLDDTSVNPVTFPKRRNFLAACRQSSCILEVGVNAGHSALLALAAGLEYHGIDICAHRYTKPITEFLKSRFPDRFFFYPGDSMKVLPDLWQKHNLPLFDLIHYDSSHGTKECRFVIDHALPHSTKNAWCIFDDSQMHTVRTAYNHYLETKQLSPDMPFGWEPFERHAIGRRIS